MKKQVVTLMECGQWWFSTSFFKEASTGEHGIQLAVEEHPDVVLVDINLPGLDGLQAAKFIKEARPACQIVTMSMFSSKDCDIKEAMTFISKSEIDQRLGPLLERLLKGKAGV